MISNYDINYVGYSKGFEFNNKVNPVEHIKTRIKTKESCIEKLIRKGYEPTKDNLINPK